MAPKKKGGKKALDDDWEAELGESIVPETTNGNGTDDNKNDDGGAGSAVLDEKAPVEATMDDEFALPEKKSKPKKAAPAAPAASGADGEDGVGRVLTKAEKEKLKKEREKQRKKEQAAAKKKGAAADGAAKAAATSATTAPAAAAASTAAPPAAASADAAATGGKKKKVPAHILALQKQQEERRRQEEEAARLLAEEKARIEEEERREAEEAKRREEAKALKKQREKERIEQLKKEGKYLTKAQKEAKARNEQKLQQMMAAGVKVGALEGGSGEQEKKADSRKRAERRNKDKVDEEKLLAEAAERARQTAERLAQEAEERARIEREKKEAEAAAAAAAAESDVEDDWETAAAAIEGGSTKKKVVKDSWDASSGDEGGEDGEEEKENDDSDNSESSDDASDDADANKKTTSTKTLPARPKEQQPAQPAKPAQPAQPTQPAKPATNGTPTAPSATPSAAAGSTANLRSPICCIMGHVDAGKTSLLDKIRQTNVQGGEAGGITQQIGATFFPAAEIRKKTAVVNKDAPFEFKVPGLLIIDTPGHESFSNLRSRGSSLCNMAILVVDILHGLQNQTLESLRMLQARKTPFVVALNKVDRLLDWKGIESNGFQDSLSKQRAHTQREFESNLEKTKLAFAEQGFNAEVFYKNKKKSSVVSLVPTSAQTGEGVPDLLNLLVQLTQTRMAASLMYLSEVQATVLEVKKIEGFGTTIDVILINGIMHEGDRIILYGKNGVIRTNIRALLTPAPLRELRVQSDYVHNKELKASMGVKISAPGLDDAIPGSDLLVVGPDEDEDEMEKRLKVDLSSVTGNVKDVGVSVKASTLGSMEALRAQLDKEKIPVAKVDIGPVTMNDVKKCIALREKNPDYAVMLCFDVKIDKDVAAFALKNDIRIFADDTVYRVIEKYQVYKNKLVDQKKEESKMNAVFPCKLEPVKVFNKTAPIVIGVNVVAGQLRLHTPIAAVKRNPATGKNEVLSLGRVTSIERDHKQMQVCKSGENSVAIKIEMGGHQPVYGRQLEDKDLLYSKISRASIETLKEFYRDELTRDDKYLLVELKPLFDVV